MTISAFPVLGRGGSGPLATDPGMTLRDYFAAKAMHALIVEPHWGEGSSATVHAWSKGFHGDDPCERFALAAYRMADAMLAERMKGESS